ncbi:MAG: membrane protein insertase YidC [Breznakibacter sp.]
MDRNSIIGMALIAAILILFWWVQTPSSEERAHILAQRDSVYKAELVREAELKAARIQDSTQRAQNPDTTDISTKLQSRFGVFAQAAQGENSFVVLENKLVKVTIATQGGRVYSVELKAYKTFDGKPLMLFNGDKNKFGFTFAHGNRVYNTNDLYFEVASKSASSAELRLKAGDNSYLAYRYELPADSYLLNFDLAPHNVGEIIGKNQTGLELQWAVDMPKQEKGRSFEIQHSGLYYKFYQDDVDYISGKDENEELRTKLEWIGYKDQFFSSVFIAREQPFSSASVATVAYEDERIPNVRSNTSQIAIAFDSRQDVVSRFSFYFGPNHFYTLQEYGKDIDLNRLVHLGWGIFGWINRFVVIPIFNWLEGGIGSYGLIILILTLIIKTVLFPLTYKSYLSTAKMKVLKPQVDEINAKIPKEKAMERQQAMMALYKKAGVNPMGGCLPMLLQLPILFAMFSFFPASIELRQEPFLWAEDLSAYDSIFTLPFSIPFYGDHVSLFCLLMAVTNLVYTHLNQEMTQSSQTMPGMKTMMYLMPVMLLFFFNSYSSGLSYYYFISTLITIGQTILIRRFVDEKALLAQIHANQKKPVQKSKFQQRLEEMAKQQQTAAKRKK